MLKLNFAEKSPITTDTECCPMPQAVQYNFVSRLQSRDVSFEPHEGPLGIKSCFRGREIYEVEGRRFAVERSSYLILNNGQRYASALQGDAPAESFCIWFRPTFAEQVLGGLCTPADRLLEDPRLTAKQPVFFFERLYAHDELVSPLLFCIYQAVNQGTASPPWLEEQFHLLLARLLQAHRNVYHIVEGLPATRQATRVELYRRLHHAKDMLDSCLELPITLTEAADAACLSPHYFLRQFKHLFRETPHQYHRRKRLEQAQRLLADTEQSVTEICFGLGFESLGSFSWLFSRQYGLSPAQYRAQYARRLPIRLLASERPAQSLSPQA
jgi:AraC-like DNA-binding protein